MYIESQQNLIVNDIVIDGKGSKESKEDIVKKSNKKIYMKLNKIQKKIFIIIILIAIIKNGNSLKLMD